MLAVDIATPVDFARIGLFSTDVAIDYGDAGGSAEPSPRRVPAHPSRSAARSGSRRSSTQQRDVGVQGRLPASLRRRTRAGSARSSPTTSRPPRPLDRTLNVDPSDDLGFLELQIFPNRIDAGIVDAIDVRSQLRRRGDVPAPGHVPGPAGERRRSSGGCASPGPTSATWTASFTHHLSNGTTRTTGPITSDASFLPVDDPFPDALDIRAIPLFPPGTVRQAFVDVTYDDEPNLYRREERLEIPGTAIEPVPLRIALLDPRQRKFRHRVTVVTTDGRLIQNAPIDGEETIIGAGGGL